MYHGPEEEKRITQECGLNKKKERVQFMSDSEILSRIRFTHEFGLGRNGFRFDYSVPSSFPFYDKGLILWNVEGDYHDSPLFRNKITISASVYSIDTRYGLTFQKQVKESCSEMVFVGKYLTPFLEVLRLFTQGQLSSSEIREQMGGANDAYEGLHSYKAPCNQYAGLFTL